MTELYAAIISAGVTVIGALVTYIVSSIKTKSIKERISTLESFFESSDGEYYIYCPKCNTKINLNQVKILYENNNKNIINK